MNTEYEIIEGLKAGHEEAYKYIYERQYKILCIIAKEYVDDTFTAEMIVSDVIFALWKNRKEIDINLSLRSYLIKAVRNRCLHYLAQLNKMSVRILETCSKKNRSIMRNNTAIRCLA